MHFPGITAIVTDIEGTTSSISFVHDVLFPYARQRLARFIADHPDRVAGVLSDIRKETGQPELTTDGCVEKLLQWMDEDKKIAPLKTLQGMIWRQGFEGGDFTGHIYEDAARQIIQWQARGYKLYIYSSGSIEAQKLLFGYSDAGDLKPLLSGYFDTTMGGKKEPDSYTKIATAIGMAPQAILFLSDHPDELMAARAAGLSIMGLIRPGNTFDLTGFDTVTTFDEIKLDDLRDSAA